LSKRFARLARRQFVVTFLTIWQLTKYARQNGRTLIKECWDLAEIINKLNLLTTWYGGTITHIYKCVLGLDLRNH